jgi:hypothetical protein
MWRTCATRDNEPRPVWTSLPITHSERRGEGDCVKEGGGEEGERERERALGRHYAQALRAATASRCAPRLPSPTSSTCVRVPMGPSHTTSTRVRVPRTEVPPPTFAPTSITTVSNLRRFSKTLASPTPNGTTLHLSMPSSWPLPKSGLAQFTVMPMPIPTLMTMPQALLHPMIVTEFLLPLWGAYRVCFFFPLYVSSGFIRGGHVTHNLSSLPGLAS